LQKARCRLILQPLAWRWAMKVAGKPAGKVAGTGSVEGAD
jgi:hypothetical protein